MTIRSSGVGKSPYLTSSQLTLILPRPHSEWQLQKVLWDSSHPLVTGYSSQKPRVASFFHSLLIPTLLQFWSLGLVNSIPEPPTAPIISSWTGSTFSSLFLHHHSLSWVCSLLDWVRMSYFFFPLSMLFLLHRKFFQSLTYLIAGPPLCPH